MDLTKIVKIPGKATEHLDASPVKSFFVEMLTRDIALDDAILDLLDNCVDGILRSSHKDGKQPYSGYWAEIQFNKHNFAVSDNCGGIPKDLQKYALRMGRDDNRPKEAAGTVGVYGIGMKRAIFKMGRHCIISTHSKTEAAEIELTPDWIKSDKWEIDVKRASRKSAYGGTTIIVEQLNEAVAAKFSGDKNSFSADLEKKIATHYAFIINKGLQVKLNGKSIQPKPIKLIFQKRQSKRPTIEPYFFEAKVGKVNVSLAVGFSRPIPSADAIAQEQEEKQWSSLDAGWTVVCNDRTVIYCDRTELTGWGEAGIPRYHTQFIAISGIVEFKADNAKDLPTTTTKRGIDAGAQLYLQVKNKMREGMKIFTDYTNKWKGRSEESKAFMEGGTLFTFDELKEEVKKVSLQKTTRSFPGGRQLKPSLPAPKVDVKERRITFVRKLNEIEAVSEYLFGETGIDPSKVGERCFLDKLREAKK